MQCLSTDVLVECICITIPVKQIPYIHITILFCDEEHT